MRTSWALGGATSTSSTDNFPPASQAIAACPASVFRHREKKVLGLTLQVIVFPAVSDILQMFSR